MASVVLRLLVAFAAGAACTIWIMKAFFDGDTGVERSPVRSPTTEAVQPLSAGSTQSTAPEAPVTKPEPRPGASAAPPSEASASFDLPSEPYRVEISPASDFHAQMLLPRPRERAPPPDAGNPKALHAMLEREPRDESWAQYAESLLRGLFRDSQLAGSVDARVIECRATLCEIQAISFAPEQAGYNRVLAELYAQRWYRDEFAVMGSAAGEIGDGSEGILIHLGRRKADSRP